MNNNLQTKQENNLTYITKELHAVLPIVEEYKKMFPTTANEEEDKKLITNFAFALSNAKDRNKRLAIDVCTQESIRKCALDILNKKVDLGKNQAYLIVYGNELQLQDSYFGKVAAVNNELHINIRANVIYEGDNFDINIDEKGLKTFKHSQKFGNLTHKIVGAYAIAYDKDNNVVESDVMTFNEIYTSWLQSQGGIKDTHKKFPHEMCKKTVEARLAKHLLQTRMPDKFVQLGDDEFDSSDYSNDSREEVNNVSFDEPVETPNDTIDTTQFEDATYSDLPNYADLQAQEPVETVVEQNVAPTPQQQEMPNYDYYASQQFDAPPVQNAPQQAQDTPKKADEIANLPVGTQVRVLYGEYKNLAQTLPNQKWSVVSGTYISKPASVVVKREQ